MRGRNVSNRETPWSIAMAGAVLAWRSAQRRKIVVAIAVGISLIAAVMLIEHHCLRARRLVGGASDGEDRLAVRRFDRFVCDRCRDATQCRRVVSRRRVVPHS
jgi:hypothetical protein